MRNLFKVHQIAIRNEFGLAATIQTPHEQYSNDFYNLINLRFWKWSIWLKAPYFVKAPKKWVDCPSWPRPNPGETKKGYWDYTRVEYGFSTVPDSGVHVYYGIQPGCYISNDPANSDHVKIFDWPWIRTHISHKAFDTSGNYLCSGKHLREWTYKYLAKYCKPYNKETKNADFQTVPWFTHPIKDDPTDATCFGEYNNFSDVSSNIEVFKFFNYKDHYDGEVTVARVNIEERTWIRGKWKWLRSILQFIPGCKLVKRYMEIEFRDEVGSKKGSWKGGILGMGFDMKPNESLDECFARFQKEWRDR